MRILVVSPSWIGDTMMSHSFYRTIKMLYPMAIIDVISSHWCLPLLYYIPEINTIIPVSFPHGSLDIKKRYHLGRSLKKQCYDRAYILPNSFKSALVPFFAGISHRIGWCGEMRYGLINDVRLLKEKDWPRMVERYIALAYDKNEISRAKNLPHPLLLPKINVNEKEKQHICKAYNLSFTRPIIGFCPGSEFGPAKCWPHYHYAKLSKYLIQEGYQIMIFGHLKEKQIGDSILEKLESEQKKWCYHLIGKTKLEQAISLMSSCEAIVTNDSGLMHIAAALNLPIVAIYGPTSPRFTPPLCYKARIISQNKKYVKIRKSNSEQGYHPSLIKITPDSVFCEIRNLLS